MLSRPVAVALAAAALCFLYFHGLADTGLQSVDEPRYASVGRDMAASGDWITPRLWGEVWLEKPPLLYWAIAAATRFGLRGEWAARLPVALMAAGFLVFFWTRLREFAGEQAAWASAAILGTSVGWMAYGSVAVTDIPTAVFFATAMLLVMPWAHGEGVSPGAAAVAGASLGMAILAKALLPVALALPVLWWGRRRWRELGVSITAMVAVAAPWYAAAWMRHGWELIDVLFLRHQLDRFFRAEAEVLHPGPFWYYVPVILAGLLPWTPLAGAVRREDWRDPAVRYCASLAVFGVLFLSASSGKLPGYALPLMPFVAAVLGIAAHRAGPLLLGGVGALAFALTLAVASVPEAIEYGIGRAPLPSAWAAAVAATLLAAGTLALRRAPAQKRLVAVAIVVAAATAWQKHELARALEDNVSARKEWVRVEREIGGRPVCENWLRRQWVYGFNYYRGSALERCADPPPEDKVRLEADPDTGRTVVAPPLR
ncbi:MAG: glycosyltransferase family 39 protein [Bryobacteraceae bacterium]